MSVLILSDLHLDVWREARRSPFENMDPHRLGSLDALILAGDVSNKGFKQWRLAIEELSNFIAPDKIHLFPGNHEFYGDSLDREDKLRDIAEANGAHYAQMKQVVSGDSRYLCCTLWTDMRHPTLSIDKNMDQAKFMMNDYRKIRIASEGYRKASPRHTAEVHRRHMTWLKAALSEPWNGRTIVVTHHAPLPICMSDPNASFAGAYVSDLSEMIATQNIDMWVSGHTHHEYDFETSGVRFVSAHLGYPHEIKTAPQFEDLGFHDVGSPDLSETCRPF